MPVSPYIARMREAVGPAVLLVPSVSVLPRDDRGRVLLVRHADSGQWGTIGGTVEIGEAPADAAVREAREEAGVDVVLGRVLGAVGGPGFHVRYPNGDETAYVAVVYEAEVAGDARPKPDGDETVEAAWHDATALATLDLAPFTRATFEALGLVDDPSDRP